MKLYHYVTKGNTVMRDGLLSFAKNPDADIHYYIKRSGCETKEGIVQWMENCFSGRSRGIRFFSEQICWHKDSLCLKKFIENADLFSIDLARLEADGLLDSIWCSPSVLDVPNFDEKTSCDEILCKLDSTSQIDYSPIDWSVCNDKKGWRFSFVRYYLIVIKNGIIPPKYLTKE